MLSFLSQLAGKVSVGCYQVFRVTLALFWNILYVNKAISKEVDLTWARGWSLLLISQPVHVPTGLHILLEEIKQHSLWEMNGAYVYLPWCLAQQNIASVTHRYRKLCKAIVSFWVSMEMGINVVTHLVILWSRNIVLLLSIVISRLSFTSLSYLSCLVSSSSWNAKNRMQMITKTILMCRPVQ